MKTKLLLFSILFITGLLTTHAAVGDKYEAEAFDEAEGARAEASNVGYIVNGTWVKFNSISFDGTEQWIEVSASGTTGGNIEFRLDAPDGALLGTAVMTGTSGWSDYQAFNANIESTTGDKVLYLVFTGGDGYLFNVGDFKLNANVPSFEITTSTSPANSGLVVTDADTNFVSQGTDLLFFAQRASGYTFSHWEDGSGTSVSTENPTTMKISQATSLTAVFDVTEETYELPKWTFNMQYLVDSTGDIHTYTPIALPISSQSGFLDAMVYPDNYPSTGTANLISNADTLYTSLTGENQVCRLSWTDANEVADFTDPSLHKQYFEFQFSTINFEQIAVDFSFSGGQNDPSDFLELVYSVDNGSSWVDGGAFYSEASWNTWVFEFADLIGAENKALVMVRLIGISLNEGASLNFNLDDFIVSGKATIPSAVKTLSTSSTKVIAGKDFIRVTVDSPTEVSIYSLDGKVINQTTVQSSLTIPSKKGIYIVKTGNETTKVLVTE